MNALIAALTIIMWCAAIAAVIATAILLYGMWPLLTTCCFYW